MTNSKRSRIDLTGQRIYLWTVILETKKPDHLKEAEDRYWLCECDCGTVKVVTQGTLRSRPTKSCGCIKKLKKESRAADNPEYKVWLTMKQRCHNPNSSRYSGWGARGIRVCDRWRKSFSDFLNDMGPRPSNQHSIDRIDVNGHYEPSNCRWVTNLEQAINRRPGKSGIVGVNYLKNKDKYRAVGQLNKKRKRLGEYKDFFEAVCARKSWEAKYAKNW